MVKHVLPVLLLAATLAASPSLAHGRVAQRPVAFEVRNTNTSPVACPSDGAAYTVRGHLTGPRGSLRGRGRKAVTFYLYGFEVGEWQWRLRMVPRYDFARRMARLGHVSLTVDMLGYDSSGHPGGFEVCTGSQADVARQIVEQLRAGSYRAGARRRGRATPAFSRVALAGHDIAGGMVELATYAYGGVDALLVLTWVDGAPGAGFSPYLMSLFAEANAACETSPERAEGDRGPGGYVFFAGPEAEYRANILWDADPAVADAAVALRNRNPCGYLNSIPPMILTNQAHLGEIEIPVLAVMGAEDRVFTPGALALQAPRYTGSGDVTAVELEGAGHFPMFGPAAGDYARLIADWLERRIGAGPPALRCMGTLPTLLGSAAGERLRGTKGRDVIVARGGRDRIRARGGNDLICAGAGRDRIDAGRGNDVVRSGPGRDRVRGGRGRDRIDGKRADRPLGTG